jgi:hypothetical protein
VEYVRETGMMIITYLTALHESFNTLLGAFSYISHTSDSFVFDTGIELLVIEKDDLRPRLPDLVFGEEKTDGPKALPEYGIIVETGYSQSVLDLDAKGLQYRPSTPLSRSNLSVTNMQIQRINSVLLISPHCSFVG